jgi:hypothetical protein
MGQRISLIVSVSRIASTASIEASITVGSATGMPMQFIESTQLRRAGNCRAFRNPDGSEE